jgi:hypothetical protein
MQAAAVCRSWRVAAVSPLVLRPNIRVQIEHSERKGVIVHGQQITFSRYEPMLAASQSMVFRNIRVLRLSHAERNGQPYTRPSSYSPRYSKFEWSYLSRWSCWCTSTACTR